MISTRLRAKLVSDLPSRLLPLRRWELINVAGFVFVANNKNNDFRHAQTIGTLYSLRESSLRAPLLLSNRSREWDTVQWGQVPPEEVESCAGTF